MNKQLGTRREIIPTHNVTRRAVSCRVIPVPGCWAEFDNEIVLGRAECSTVNFSKSVNLFGQAIFCICFSRPWLSIRVVKSQNEFETKPGLCNKGSVHDV